MTLAGLAARATKALALTPAGREHGGTVSISYLSLIETGRKVPDEEIAVAVARALGDDVRIHRAWVRARKRSDLDAALKAAETLRDLLGRGDAAARAPSEAQRARRRGTRSQRASSFVGARLRVPVIAAGSDPGEGLRPTCEVLEWLRIELDELSPDDRERLDRPFAYRLDAVAARRVRDAFAPGDVALVLRTFAPIEADAIYAIRSEGRMILSRVLWNGSSLLLMPVPGESDFIVVDIGSETLLGRHVMGRIAEIRLSPNAGGRAQPLARGRTARPRPAHAEREPIPS